MPAGRARAVAAVNGDFFDINNSGAAQGIGVHEGDLVQSPIAATTTPSRSRPTGSDGCCGCTSTAPRPPRAAPRSR
ncbi:hypothetical protein ACFQX6_16720 [Streptosporangium lutulentum]